LTSTRASLDAALGMRRTAGEAAGVAFAAELAAREDSAARTTRAQAPSDRSSPRTASDRISSSTSSASAVRRTTRRAAAIRPRETSSRRGSITRRRDSVHRVRDQRAEHQPPSRAFRPHVDRPAAIQSRVSAMQGVLGPGAAALQGA
jgi:hypothetical protein